MEETTSLYLREEVLLLALRDREGTIATGTMYTYALGGAIMVAMMASTMVTAANR